MRKAFEAASGTGFIYAGDIYSIPDERLHFADNRPEVRTRHESRPVIVMQGDDIAENQSCDTVLVIPLSSNTANKQSWEGDLTSSESGLRHSSTVKVQLLQPVPRVALVPDGRYLSRVNAQVLRRIQRLLLTNLGIVPQSNNP